MSPDPEHPRRIPRGEEGVLQGEDDRPRGRDPVVTEAGQEREGDRKAEVPEPHEEGHDPRHPHPVVGDVDREEGQHREVDREVNRQEDHQRCEEGELLPHPDSEELWGKPTDEPDRERHGKPHQFYGALRDPDQGLGLFPGITGEDRRCQDAGEHPGDRPQEDDPLEGDRVLPARRLPEEEVHDDEVDLEKEEGADLVDHHPPPHPAEIPHPSAVKGADRDPEVRADPAGEDDRDPGSHDCPGEIRPADEGEIGAEEGEEEDDQPGLDDEVRNVDPVLEVEAVVGEELDREVPAPGPDQEGGRDPEEEEDRTGLLPLWDIEDRRRKVRDHEDDRDHQEDDCGEPEEGRVERLIRRRVIFSLEVDGEEPGDRSVERLDDDRHVPRDRGRERDEPVGRDPEGVDEVGDQKDPDDDVYQEVGNVCGEVAGELGGKPPVCLVRAGRWFRCHGVTGILGTLSRVVSRFKIWHLDVFLLG